MKRYVLFVNILLFLFFLTQNAGAKKGGAIATLSHRRSVALAVNSEVALSPVITASTANGAISACVGSASANPNIEQITVSGSNLTGNIIAMAPADFEVSLTAGSGYGSSVTLTQTGGAVNNEIVYVRSAASAAAGDISENVTLTSTGAVNQNVLVTGVINALPTVDKVPDQTSGNGSPTAAINFTGTANIFTWTNNTPGIGLAASGLGDIPSFTAVNTGSTPVVATIIVTPKPEGYAYITSISLGNVSVINTATNAVISTIAVGSQPQGVYVSRDGSKVYVVNNGSNSVSVIDIATNTVIATIPVGSLPSAITESRDGTELFVANVYDNTVSVISAATNKVTSTISGFDQPYFLIASSASNFLYVENSPPGTVSVVDIATNTIVNTIKVGQDPIQLTMNSNGSLLYSTNEMDNTVSVINTATNTVIATIPVDNHPYSESLTPDGSLLYVGCIFAGVVDVIDTKTNKVIKTINENAAAGISVTPDGKYVYITNDATPGTVSVVSTATNVIIATVQVGDYPYSIGNFIAPGPGCSGTPIKFTITVSPGAASLAVITVAPGSPSPLATIYGTPSTSTVFDVSGANLTAGILVSPPQGFEVSTDDIKFSPVVTVGSAGSISNINVYIRLAATTHTGNYSGNIVLSSAGAEDALVVMPLSTVTPAPLTITADDKFRVFGVPNPSLTASYTGFKNNDTPVDLTVPPELSTTATISSAVGLYPISVTGGFSPDYNTIPISGVLTIVGGIVVPNAFTPNGDGINDVWDIKYLNSYLNCTVQIYNRYGENVYSSIGYGTPWDGTYKGSRLPTGTYYYIINLKNGHNTLSGFVAIIR